jgi:hypothetical protein
MEQNVVNGDLSMLQEVETVLENFCWTLSIALEKRYKISGPRHCSDTEMITTDSWGHTADVTSFHMKIQTNQENET